MPETTLDRLESVTLEFLNMTEHKQGLKRDRDYLIRKAHAEGSTFHELSKATGLSRAQVQRICDYSKDRGQ